MRFLAYGLVALLLNPVAASAGSGKPDWNSIQNIESAVEDFMETNQQQGNQKAREESQQCYRQAIKKAEFTKQMEYCIAFDVANIEFTTAFYQQLAKRYGGNGIALQPEETTRPVGKKRILDSLVAVKVSNAEEIADLLYRAAKVTLYKYMAKHAGEHSQ